MRFASALLIALLAACRTPSEPAATYAALAYVEILSASDPPALSESEQQEAFAGHFSNMQVMSDAGQLLLAGPVGEPQPRAGQRGVYIFDEADAERALEYAHTDPAFQAGIFEMVAHSMCGEAALRLLPGLEVAAVEAGLAGLRAYVLAFVPLEFELGALRAEGRVLFEGWLGEEFSGERMLLLDYADFEAATMALGSRAAPERWRAAPFWSTSMLAEVPAASLGARR